MYPHRVSVVIPTYNGAPWLADCLASVFAQSAPPAEIIVVNDGSTDGTAQLLARYEPRVRVVHQRQGGIGAARNRGVAEATGDFLAFLDHDDLWLPEKLARQIRQLSLDPTLTVSHTDADEFDERGVIHASYVQLFPGLAEFKDPFASLVDFQVPLMSTVLVRADFLRRHGLRLVETASGVDDIGLFLEIAARGGRFGLVPQQLARRRLHQNNLSKNHFNRFSRRIALYGELLDRLPHATAAQRAHLQRGLRQAHYRVGEWHWGRGEPALAARHWSEAHGCDALGLRVALYAAAAKLPHGLIRGLRQWKQRLASGA